MNNDDFKKQEFSKIYDEYINKIYRFVFLKVNSQEVAEDITSETFSRGWQAYRDQRPKTKDQRETKNQKEIENISAFLYQIAKNLVTDFYRQKQKFKIVTVENVTITDPAQNPIESANLNAEMAIARKALSRLKDNYQDVIIWHYLDELSIPEIAKILDKSEGAVRIMLSRAMKALRMEINMEINNE